MPELFSSTPKPSPEPENKISTTASRVREFLPPRAGHSFSSFWILPSEQIRFETQEEQEKILMILRRHWLTNILWFLMSVILFLAPAVLRYFPLLSSFPARFQLMFVIIWYLILLMFVFERFLAWFFNMSIITDERIIDVDFLNLTTKKVADADIDKIQDVTFTNNGAIGTIFNYGNVLVQTAAEVVEFVFDSVPNPGKVADVLQHLRIEEKQEAIEGRIN